VAVGTSLPPLTADAFAGNVGDDSGRTIVVRGSLPKSLTAGRFVDPTIGSDISPIGSLSPFVIHWGESSTC
jgi:hypothetical protein